MLEKTKVEAANDPSPARAEWALQAEVVDALLESLGKGVREIETLARIMHEHMVISSGIPTLGDGIAQFVRDRFGAERFPSSERSPGLRRQRLPLSEDIASDLCDILKRQQQWLKKHRNLPPVEAMKHLPRVVREEIQARYASRPPEKDVPNGPTGLL